uniref:Uncharacterized protein n=1 Tax=viral metagenome TaxID=1070528 RepID=A0A6C0L7W5_9ZZZZ
MTSFIKNKSNDLNRYINPKRLPEPAKDDSYSVIVDATFPPKDHYAAFSYVFKNLINITDIKEIKNYCVRPLIEIEETQANFDQVNNELFKTEDIKEDIVKNFSKTTSSNVSTPFNEPYPYNPIINLTDGNSNLVEIKKIIVNNVTPLFNKDYIPNIKINSEITEAVLKYDLDNPGSVSITEVPIYFVVKGSYDNPTAHVSTFIYFKKKFYSLGFLKDSEDNSVISSVDPLLFYNKMSRNRGYEKQFMNDHYLQDNPELMRDFVDRVISILSVIKKSIKVERADLSQYSEKYNSLIDTLKNDKRDWELKFGSIRFFIELIKIIEDAEKQQHTPLVPKEFYVEFVRLSNDKINNLFFNLASSPFTGNYIIDIGVLTQFHIDNIKQILLNIVDVRFNFRTNKDKHGNPYIRPSLLTYILKSKYSAVCLNDIWTKGKYKDVSSTDGRSSKIVKNPRNTTVFRKALSESNCTNNTAWIFSDSIHCIGRGGISPTEKLGLLPHATDYITIPGACVSGRLQEVYDDGTSDVLLKEIDYDKINGLPDLLTDPSRTMNDFISLFDMSLLSLKLHLKVEALANNKRSILDRFRKKRPLSLAAPILSDAVTDIVPTTGGINKNYLLNRFTPFSKRRTHKRKIHKRKIHKRKTYKRQ